MSSRLRRKQTTQLRRRLVTNPINPGSVARWIIINRPPILDGVSNQEIIQFVRDYWDMILPHLPAKLGITEFRQVTRLASRYKRLSHDNSSHFLRSVSNVPSLRQTVTFAQQEQQQHRWGILWLLVGIGIGYLIWGREK